MKNLLFWLGLLAAVALIVVFCACLLIQAEHDICVREHALSLTRQTTFTDDTSAVAAEASVWCHDNGKPSIGQLLGLED